MICTNFQHGLTSGKCLLTSTNVMFFKWKQETKNMFTKCAEKKLESMLSVKDLDVSIASNLKLPQQCKDVVGKTYKLLNFVQRFFFIKNKNVIQPPYISLVRLSLEYAKYFWSHHLAQYITILETVQCRATKMIPSLCNKSY